jgi:hypothetical protein
VPSRPGLLVPDLVDANPRGHGEHGELVAPTGSRCVVPTNVATVRRADFRGATCSCYLGQRCVTVTRTEQARGVSRCRTHSESCPMVWTRNDPGVAHRDRPLYSPDINVTTTQPVLLVAVFLTPAHALATARLGGLFPGPSVHSGRDRQPADGPRLAILDGVPGRQASEP